MTDCSNDDMMQALVCLHEFAGLGAGSAAASLLQDHNAGRDSDCGWVSNGAAHLHLGPCMVHMSLAALELVAKAFHDAPARSIAIREVCGHKDYDLRDDSPWGGRAAPARERPAGGAPRGRGRSAGRTGSAGSPVPCKGGRAPAVTLATTPGAVPDQAGSRAGAGLGYFLTTAARGGPDARPLQGAHETGKAGTI